MANNSISIPLGACTFHAYCQQHHIKPDNAAWDRYISYLNKLGIFRTLGERS